jgi:N6-adenosine-specific RNA methylase IME4
MIQLVKYETARAALEEAHRFDEVKDVRDKAIAMEAYARVARDGAMVEWATDIKLRAERKAGAILRFMRESGERARGGGDLAKNRTLATLADIGVNKDQSSRWQKLAALDEATFEKRASMIRRQAARSIEATPAERLAEMQAKRNQRELELGRKQIAWPTRRYGVILADPEWRFEPHSRETGMSRAADNHYSTSTTADIAARDVASIAAPDCALFLWVPAPMNEHGMLVMKAWGFAYKAQQVWVKDRAITGYWFLGLHELLLVGTRGDFPAPAPGTQEKSVLEAPAGEHSQKPEAVAAWIERLWPNLPKIELNRRGPARDGWDAWGWEAGSANEAAA